MVQGDEWTKNKLDLERRANFVSTLQFVRALCYIRFLVHYNVTRLQRRTPDETNENLIRTEAILVVI